MTTAGRTYPWRVPCRFQGKCGLVVLDQLRAIDQERAAGRLGRLSGDTMGQVAGRLQQMFAGSCFVWCVAELTRHIRRAG